VVLLLVPLFAGYFVSFVAAGAVVLVAGLTIALISVFGFAPFQRLIERWVLRIPEAPDHLVAAFAGRLSTSFTQEHLVDLLQKEVLPSLLIRQSTLISLGEGRPDVVYLQGLKRSQLPPRRQQQAILETSSAAPEGVAAFPEHAWLRLAVPLKVAQEPLGLWLLGRKDPDDLYTHSEQSLLRSLADQMAIALANISQAHNLRSLYQRDIERQEEERVHLARELHDDILNDMNLLLTEATQAVDSKEFSKKHLALDDRVRRLIHGLRPPMLNYGLVHAFSQLADELRAKSSEVEIRLSFNSNEESYEKKVQEHIYRVVQQAAENALEHGKAQLISISGTLQPNAIDILVEDDGAGFRLKGNDLAHLLETKHFGLAGMSERAALIGARLQIHSSPRRGTRVSLTWRQKD
jgi:signal transduction histidine kinase